MHFSVGDGAVLDTAGNHEQLAALHSDGPGQASGSAVHPRVVSQLIKNLSRYT